MHSQLFKSIFASLASLILYAVTFAQQGYSKNDSIQVYLLNKKADIFLHQNNGLDSAIKYSQQALKYSQQVNFLRGEGLAEVELANLFFKKSENGLIETYQNAALKIGELLNDDLIIADAYKSKADWATYVSKHREALRFYEKALNIKYEREQSAGTAEIYNKIGFTYLSLGELEKQMQWQTKSLHLFEKLDEKAGIASAKDNIAEIYLELGKNKAAIEYAKQACLIREALNNYEDLATGYNNLAQIYHFSDSVKLAEFYGALGLKYAILSGIKNRIAHAYTTQSLLYNRHKKNAESLDFEKKAIAILEQTGDDMMLARRYIAAAIISQSKEVNDSAGAVYFYQKALGLATKINSRINLRDVYFFRSDFYRRKADFEKAYLDYKKHIVFRDSVINEETQSKIADIEAKYDAEKKDNEIIRLTTDKKINALQIEKQQALINGNMSEAQKKQNEIALLSKEKELQDLQINRQGQVLEKQVLEAKTREQKLRFAEIEKSLRDEEIKNQKLVRNLLLAVLALVLSLGAISFNRYQLGKKLEQQKGLLAMRSHISQDLHDDIGASLSNISILNELAKRNLIHPEKSKEYLAKASEDIQRISESLSDIVWNINPRYDDAESLFIRMKRYAADMFDARNIKGQFTFPDEIKQMNLTMAQRRDLYLIFKEAVNNLVKYSGAANALINISMAGKNIYMLIKDDGKGFDPASAEKGNGLRNMRQRAHASGAEISIKSQPGKGTEILLQLYSS